MALSMTLVGILGVERKKWKRVQHTVEFLMMDIII